MSVGQYEQVEQQKPCRDHELQAFSPHLVLCIRTNQHKLLMVNFEESGRTKLAVDDGVCAA